MDIITPATPSMTVALVGFLTSMVAVTVLMVLLALVGGVPF
jgi:hypothetical protein